MSASRNRSQLGGLRAVHSELPVRFDPGEQHGLMQRQALMTKADQCVEPRPAQPGHHSEQGQQGLAVLPASKAVARVDLRIMRGKGYRAHSWFAFDVMRVQFPAPKCRFSRWRCACAWIRSLQGVWLKNAALSPSSKMGDGIWIGSGVRSASCFVFLGVIKQEAQFGDSLLPRASRYSFRVVSRRLIICRANASLLLSSLCAWFSASPAEMSLR